MPAIEIKVGDIFLLPLAVESWAVGQIVSTWNEELYVAIFNDQAKSKDDSERVVISSKPAILCLTLDAKLWNGSWPIVGNVKSNISAIPQPSFKVRQNGVTHIESRDRTINRPASESECAILRYRTVSSPAIVERAVRAYFNLEEWREEYDAYLADYAERSGSLV